MIARRSTLAVLLAGLSTFVFGCNRNADEPEATKSAEAVSAGTRAAANGGKRFSAFAVPFTVGKEQQVGAATVKLVSISGGAIDDKAVFSIGDTDTTVGRGECFAAGVHTCSAHEPGTSQWCVVQLSATHSLISPKGHAGDAVPKIDVTKP